MKELDFGNRAILAPAIRGVVVAKRASSAAAAPVGRRLSIGVKSAARESNLTVRFALFA
jgi:2-keto-3-deoxy-L-rhamnonate aldolase RhmA